MFLLKNKKTILDYPQYPSYLELCRSILFAIPSASFGQITAPLNQTVTDNSRIQNEQTFTRIYVTSSNDTLSTEPFR